MFSPYIDGVLMALGLLVGAAIVISLAMLAAASMTRSGRAPHGGIGHDVPPQPQPEADEGRTLVLR